MERFITIIAQLAFTDYAKLNVTFGDGGTEARSRHSEHPKSTPTHVRFAGTCCRPRHSLPPGLDGYLLATALPLVEKTYRLYILAREIIKKIVRRFFFLLPIFFFFQNLLFGKKKLLFLLPSLHSTIYFIHSFWRSAAYVPGRRVYTLLRTPLARSLFNYAESKGVSMVQKISSLKLMNVANVERRESRLPSILIIRKTKKRVKYISA